MRQHGGQDYQVEVATRIWKLEVLPVIPSSSSKTSHSLRSICALHSRRQAGVVTIYSLPVAARYVEQDGLSGVILDYGLRSQDVAMPYAVT